MKKLLCGNAFIFGKNIDTDQIYPGRYLDLTDAPDVAKHAMEGASDPNFAKDFKDGDIIVAGTNFGCGSSREHAVITLVAAGVGAVLAESFARIFYRNAINIGLPVLEIGPQVEKIEAGDQVEVDMQQGLIQIKNKNLTIKMKPLPEFIQKIADAGGLVNYVKGNAK